MAVRVVQPVSDDPLVPDIEPDVVDLDLDFDLLCLVQQGGGPDRGRTVRFEDANLV